MYNTITTLPPCWCAHLGWIVVSIKYPICGVYRVQEVWVRTILAVGKMGRSRTPRDVTIGRIPEWGAGSGPGAPEGCHHHRPLHRHHNAIVSFISYTSCQCVLVNECIDKVQKNLKSFVDTMPGDEEMHWILWGSFINNIFSSFFVNVWEHLSCLDPSFYFWWSTGDVAI